LKGKGKSGTKPARKNRRGITNLNNTTERERGGEETAAFWEWAFETRPSDRALQEMRSRKVWKKATASEKKRIILEQNKDKPT